MASKKDSRFIKRNSRLLIKLGITFVIPLFLSITGAMIILSAGWNLIAQTYMMGKTIFSEPVNDIGSVEFTINGVEMYRPNLGEEFGTLTISRLNLEKQVIHGDSPRDLARGVGHYAGSTLPGEGGNVVLSGHRETAFKDLKDIQLEDSIFIKTNWGTHEYRVKDIKIVDDEDHYVLDPTDYEQLTMYTCYPFHYVGSSPQRFVVICEFIKTWEDLS